VRQIKNKPIVDVREFQFTRINGSNASGNLASPGAGKTITLSPCPFGVAGTDTNHYLYIYAGTGTAEAVLITGGTCTTGNVGGTVVVTTANAHSGAWIIASATAGGQEAFYATAGSFELWYKAGTYDFYAPLRLDRLSASITVRGQGQFATALYQHNPAMETIVSYNNIAPRIEGVQVAYITPASSGVAAIHLEGAASQAPEGLSFQARIDDVFTVDAYMGVKLMNQTGMVISRSDIRGQKYGLTMDFTSSQDGGDNVIEASNFRATSASVGETAGIYHVARGGWYLVGNKIFGQYSGGYGYLKDAFANETGIVTIVGNSFEEGDACIRIRGADNVFTRYTITGNVIDSNFAEPFRGIDISGNYKSGVISGNSFRGWSFSRDPILYPQIGVWVEDGPDNWTISGNNFGAFDTAINYGVTATNIKAFANSYGDTGAETVTLACAGDSTSNWCDSTIPATSASIGGAPLLAGACASTTTAVSGANSGVAVSVTPVTYPGDGNYWFGYVSAANVITTKVCAAVAGTPTASTYNIRVIR
jgi:hypothetical protein